MRILSIIVVASLLLLGAVAAYRLLSDDTRALNDARRSQGPPGHDLGRGRANRANVVHAEGRSEHPTNAPPGDAAGSRHGHQREYGTNAWTWPRSPRAAPSLLWVEFQSWTGGVA